LRATVVKALASLLALLAIIVFRRGSLCQSAEASPAPPATLERPPRLLVRDSRQCNTGSASYEK